MIYLDTETINFTENVEYDVCTQLAIIIDINKTHYYDNYCKPEQYKEMTFGSMEATDITPEFLEDKPLIQQTVSWKVLNKLADDNHIIMAHNVKFDLEVIRRTGIDITKFKVIDTLKICRFINDNLGLPWEACRLTHLKYALGLYKNKNVVIKELGIDRELSSHDALSDTIDLMLLWKYLQKEYNITEEQGIQITEQPILLNYIPSGKHKGKLINELDHNSLCWYRDNFYDEDVKYTCRKILGED